MKNYSGAGLMLSMIIGCFSCNLFQPEKVALLSQAESVIAEHPDSALVCLKAIAEPEHLGKKTYMNYQLLLIEAKDRSDKDISADTAIAEAKEYFSQKNNWNKASLAAFYLGRVFTKRNDFPRATQAFLEAENYAENIDNDKRKALIQHNLGELYYKQSHYDQAISKYKKANTYFQSAGRYKHVITSYVAIGNCMLLNKQQDSSLYYYEKGLDVAVAHNDSGACASVLQGISVAYRGMNNKIKAKEYAQQAIMLDPLEVGKAWRYQNLALIYHDLQQNDSAIFYAKKALQMLEDEKNSYTALTTYELLSNIESEAGNYQQALAYYKRYVGKLYYIYQENEQKSIIGIQEQYNFEVLKNKNNKLLIQRLWISLLAACALLILAGLGFFFYRRSVLQKAELLKTKGENKELNHQWLNVYKHTAFFENLFPQQEQMRNAGLLKKVKQMIAGTEEGLTWESFYPLINQVYDGILDRVKKQIPELDKTEFKICSLSLADFTNQEMANLLNLSINTIQTKKVLVRKKLSIAERGNIKDGLIEKFAKNTPPLKSKNYS